MRIIFILEDMPDGEVNINSIRMALGDSCDTPANRLAKTLEQKLTAYSAKAKAEKTGVLTVEDLEKQEKAQKCLY